jgi:Shikimate kinase|nr:shikimate kinase [Johnsonella ignava]
MDENIKSVQKFGQSVETDRSKLPRNITLIGMPASGKSSVGVVLAKRLGMKFVDVDIIIQEKYNKLLKELIEEYGDDGFRKIEEQVNAELDISGYVIAPGGSVIYGESAMKNLKKISTVVYLELPYGALKSRLGDLRARGVSFAPGQTLRSLYYERLPYYERYADITVNEVKKSIKKVVEEITCKLLT